MIFVDLAPIDIVEYLRFREDKFINMKTINLNSDHALYRELINDAKEYIRPDIEGTCTTFDGEGRLSFSYTEAPLLYTEKMDTYDALLWFIKNITIRHCSLFDDSSSYGEGRRLWAILDRSKQPRDYTIVLQIIFKMIRRGFLNKREVIDAVSKTKNTAALVELIKFEDYSVFDERLQL